MKRLLSLLLALALLLSLASCATALEMTDYAIITADIPTDRLNLRKTASADAESLGRYYIGTRVRLISEKGDFTYVEIGEGEGAARGYMLTKYLVRLTKDANYMSDIFRSSAKSGGELLDAPTSGGKVIDTFSQWDDCVILGDAGDDWRHVMIHGLFGYVRAARLNEKTAYVWLAHLKADVSDAVTLYEAQSLSSRVIGSFISDTAVEITAMSKNGWAHVTIFGTGNRMPGDLSGSVFSGYVQTKNININDPTLMERVMRRSLALPVWEITRDVRYFEDNQLLKGTRVIGIGYLTNGEAVFQYNDGIYTAPFDAMILVGNHVSNRDLPTIGYGFAANAAENGYVCAYTLPDESAEAVWYYEAGNRFNVTGILNDFYQMSEDGNTTSSYISKSNTTVYLLDDLLAGSDGTFGAGAYEAGKDIKAALYTLKNGKATVTLGEKTKAYESVGDCTFYLPAGATLTVEAGAVARANDQKLLTQDEEFAADVSGRYLAGVQLTTRNLWEYKVRAAQEGAYYIVSSLINDDLTGEITREEQRIDLEAGETYLLTLYDSEIVEFSHCDVEVFYGNG